ncbi:hypothetical protein V5O48_017996 [Marasmius crinis-equi]|uniref:P-type ATPase A domain-containing protein n=1 Tax=Marasmius crinis-equi TaxID=585013 RepID=A0ABR3EMG6_9AGAR
MANALTLILVAAMAISFGVQNLVEGSVFTAVIVLNISVGFFQEYRAEKTIDSLRSLSSPTAVVVRNSENTVIAARLLVPVDIAVVKMGDVAPADLRMLSVTNLEADEALLTGEALPEIERIWRLRVEGEGKGVVVATGIGTQVGSIASALQDKKKKKDVEEGKKIPLKTRVYEKIMTSLGLCSGTPLQIKLSKLAYVLFLCAIPGYHCLWCGGVRRRQRSGHLHHHLAISVIPESSIAVLTITISAGTRRMVKQSVIVRKLNALEALGGVTDIRSDKTNKKTFG